MINQNFYFFISPLYKQKPTVTMKYNLSIAALTAFLIRRSRVRITQGAPYISRSYSTLG